MSETPDFDWWLDHVTVDHYAVETPGARDAFATCPVHGGSDGLHLTERNGKCMVTCFACGASYKALVDAATELAEDAPDTAGDATPAEVTGPTITLGRPKVTAVVAPVADPMAWYGSYCGVDPLWIATLGVEARGEYLAHTWAGIPIAKLRRPNDSARVWDPKGATPPLLWPFVVTFPLEHEIWLVEGESDVIVMRLGYNLPAYTSGSATTLLDADEFSVLRGMGVDSVVIAYDNDKAGRKAQREMVAAAREAGLMVSVAEPGHPFSGGPKDWRERWLANPDPADTPPKGAAGTELDVWEMEDIEPSVDVPLLLGRLDPDDHTILFGDGGAGKGVLAAWWVSCLTAGRKLDDNPKHRDTQQAKTVLILDYEAHARTEWRKRLEAFDADMGRVVLVQPSRPIWDIAPSVREVIQTRGVDYVVVDSALYACAGADAYKPEGATQYSLAIAQFQRPVLTLAHKTKARDDTTKYPFGTVFWHNGARLTISIDAEGYDTPRKLQTRKANHGDDFTIEVDWTWVKGGLPPRLDEADASPSVENLVLAEIPIDGSFVSAADITQALQKSGIVLATNAVPKALGRLSKKGLAANVPGQGWKMGTGRPQAGPSIVVKQSGGVP